MDTAATLGTWKGLVVRLLDGTTYRLRPYGDLVDTYPPTENQHGLSYWLTVRSLAAFCLFTQAVVAYAEADHHTSEPAMVKDVMAADPVAGSVYVADMGLGVYRVAQVGRHYGHPVTLRLTPTRAKALYRATYGKGRLLRPGEEAVVEWAPTANTKVEPNLSTAPITGRLIHARVEKKGFRPLDIYLFTTLLDTDAYPAADICTLYGQRLQVEIDYRHVKTTLEMEEFDVQSTAMFRKELAAGLLTYNLVCACMVKAGLLVNLPPSRLSFSRCMRRVRTALFTGTPAWVYAQGEVQTYLLRQLAKCKLPYQPHKVQYEPRKVRRRPATFPALKGSRKAARQEVLAALGYTAGEQDDTPSQETVTSRAPPPKS
jgi:hypothetical protein